MWGIFILACRSHCGIQLFVIMKSSGWSDTEILVWNHIMPITISLCDKLTILEYTCRPCSLCLKGFFVMACNGGAWHAKFCEITCNMMALNYEPVFKIALSRKCLVLSRLRSYSFLPCRPILFINNNVGTSWNANQHLQLKKTRLPSESHKKSCFEGLWYKNTQIISDQGTLCKAVFPRIQWQLVIFPLKLPEINKVINVVHEYRYLYQQK